MGKATSSHSFLSSHAHLCVTCVACSNHANDFIFSDLFMLPPCILGSGWARLGQVGGG